ncbi:MAG: anti-anti-sigma factor [Actinomycetia bacterium]|jgi:anti-sigma B factor antagonist|nr:anti-anti-sigma factor [Actinomycetes bacterium]
MSQETGEPSTDLSIDVRAAGDGTVVVKPEGALDFGHHQRLQDALVAEIEAGHPRIVIDASGVSFWDSSALGVLIHVHHQAKFQEGWLRVARPSEQLRRSLEVTNLNKLLDCYSSVDAALAG